MPRPRKGSETMKYTSSAYRALLPNSRWETVIKPTA